MLPEVPCRRRPREPRRSPGESAAITEAVADRASRPAVGALGRGRPAAGPIGTVPVPTTPTPAGTPRSGRRRRGRLTRRPMVLVPQKKREKAPAVTGSSRSGWRCSCSSSSPCSGDRRRRGLVQQGLVLRRARRGYVAIFQGRPGGLLWFKPSVVERTTLTPDGPARLERRLPATRAWRRAPTRRPATSCATSPSSARVIDPDAVTTTTTTLGSPPRPRPRRDGARGDDDDHAPRRPRPGHDDHGAATTTTPARRRPRRCQHLDHGCEVRTRRSTGASAGSASCSSPASPCCSCS